MHRFWKSRAFHPGMAALLLGMQGCATTPVDPVESDAKAAPVAPAGSMVWESRVAFRPTEAQVALAARLGPPESRAEALTLLESLSPAERVDTLRAGLRLPDLAAARECAARLTWQQMDRGECARAVDLLLDEVIRPGSSADFDEFRSYLGSVEVPRFLEALERATDAEDVENLLGHLHRILRVEHLPDLIRIAGSGRPDLAEGAASNIGLLCKWNDGFREEVQTDYLRFAGQEIPPASPEPGLHRLLAAGLRMDYLSEDAPAPAPGVPEWDRRWLWDSVPGPRDATLLMELARCESMEHPTPSDVAILLLGLLRDAETEAFLRSLVDEGEDLALWALARRGDAAAVEAVRDATRTGEEFALALLMEVDPAGARSLMEEILLGPDEVAAHAMLDELEKFATPGAWNEPLGFQWRKTSFDGFAERAMTAGISGLRLARIGVVVPGSRTRSLGLAAARSLAPGQIEDAVRLEYFTDTTKAFGFLETAAPDELADSLRSVRAGGGELEPGIATELLLLLADPATCSELAGNWDFDAFEWSGTKALARSRTPEVRVLLEKMARGEIGVTGGDDRSVEALDALTVFHVPFLWPFEFHDEPLSSWRHQDGIPEGVAARILAGQPLEALLNLLELQPDTLHGDVWRCDHPGVRAYLQRLRVRRDLDAYWYATAQLAALGNEESLAEFWGAMQDGRYRILDSATEGERTLGFDLGATMPFWIQELRSQCCRIVTNGGGDIVEDLLGLESLYQSPERIPYRRAQELWESAGGRFVYSRIAGHWVPESSAK